MDIRTFVIEIIDKLVWPTTLLILVFAFRKHILNIISTFKKMKFGDLEFEFQREMVELKTEANKIRKIEPKNYEDTRILEILVDNETYPRGAILQAWISFESSINTTLKHFNLIEKDDNIPFHKTLKRLKEEDYISPEVYGVIEGLRKLRNEVAHSSSLSINLSEVKDYILLVREMTEEVIGEIAKKNSSC